jgi:hypothetical protein
MKIKLARKSVAIFLLFAALVLSVFTVLANGPFLNGSTFIKGANLPWIDGDFYNDIAVNPHYPTWGCAYNSAHMNAYLADLHRMGITVVRFWLNTDDQGCTLDANGYVTGVTALFWTNLDNVVSLAGSNGISLYLTLNEGRADWLYTNAMANAYKTNCLIPLIQRYKGNPGIFAIDLMNEIDGVVGGSDGNWGTGPTWAQAQAYITNLASAIHSADSNRLVSCSTGWHQWNNLAYFKGLGLDFYDFHEYADTISLPAASSFGMDKPVYIGECGQAYADTTWSDSLQSNCELAALNRGSSGGYAGVSIWSYSLPDWQTSGYTQYAMLNTNGTWRPVCYTIQSWNAATPPVISWNLPIYVDSLLNGFQDQSWATVNYNNTSPVYAGSDSISVTAAQWEALWPAHAPFNTAPYASLAFGINGGPAGAAGLQVMGVVTNTYQAIYNLPSLTANTWVQFNIPLSALGVANVTNCAGFWFRASSTGPTTFYVDSIQLNSATKPSLAAVSSQPKSGLFVLQLSGLSGQSYWIETSTNLTSWSVASTNAPTYSSVNVTNPVTGNSSHRYWRAYWP